MSNAFVCIMGIGTVFFGLICLVFITMLVSAIAKIGGNKKEANAPKVPAAVSGSASEAIENKEELIAAVCAAIAEDIGTDANNIRVLSFKKL